jgi:hypothetical protein
MSSDDSHVALDVAVMWEHSPRVHSLAAMAGWSLVVTKTVDIQMA